MPAIDLAAGLVRQFEGCRLTAYPDMGKGIWTIGFGHTGPEVHQGLSWTQGQADSALVSDLQDASENVSRLITASLSDRQKAALTCLAFNVPVSDLATSQLRKEINAAQWLNAAHEWVRWDHAAGKESIGLLRRRLIEATTFLEGS